MLQQSNLLSASDKSQKKCGIAFCWFVLSLFLTNVGLGLEDNYGISQHSISICLKLITVTVFIWALYKLIYKNPVPTILAVIFVVPLILYSFAFQQDNIYLAENVVRFILYVFPIIILSLYLTDYALLLALLKKVSLVIGFMCLVMLMLFVGGIKLFSSNYAMGLSYSCLLPLLILLRYNFNEISLSCLVATISLIAVILFFGSRGAFVCIFAFMVFVLIRMKKLKILLHLLLILILFVGMLYFFGESLVAFLEAKHIHARSILLFSNIKKTGVTLSGRELVYANAMTGINSLPWQFKGMFASYVLNEGSYPHLIFLEAWYDMGIFSIVFFAVCAWTVFKSFCYDDARGDIAISLMAYSVSLLLSNSFWVAPYFWMWLVIVLKQNGIVKKCSN